MSDMTIAAIRTTMLRIPWPDTPWLKGHAFGDTRNLLVLDVETKSGIVGMGYLFSFRPGLRAIATALEEAILPRVIGKDATAVEHIWHDLWHATATYNRGGIVTMAMSALDIARRFEDVGVSAIVYTDIARDGMLQGLNLDATIALANAISIPVIASGGLASIEDIKALLAPRAEKLAGAIAGRALYDGRVDATEALGLIRAARTAT